MYNKTFALVLALFITSSELACDLAPSPAYTNSDIDLTDNSQIHKHYIITHFGEVESSLKEDDKLELIIKEQSDLHSTIAKEWLIMGIGASIACVLNAKDLSPVIGIFSSIVYHAYHAWDAKANEANINLEKNEQGNWAVVNSVYDQEINDHLAQAADALEKDDIQNTEIFAKLEKIFATKQN